MSSGEIVKLNIGGTHFQTSKSTLTKFYGFFRTVLETEVPIAKDESGAIFVDRSAKHFDSILDYMREGRLNLPESSKDVKDIQDEARYYLLEGIVQLCERKLRDRAERSVMDGSDIEILKNEKEYFRVIAKPVKPTLVIYCPSVYGTVSHPNGFKLQQFLRQYGNTLDIYFRKDRFFSQVENHEIQVPFERIPSKTDFNCHLWSWSLHWNEKHQKDGLRDKRGRDYTVSLTQLSFDTELRNSVEKFLRENRPA